jgi:hypothetical protein
MKLDKAANKPMSERVKKAKSVKASFPIPFNGKAIEGCCAGLRFNRGLFTQCSAKVKAEGFCKSCQAQADKNGNGKPDNGTIADRLCVGLYDFRDPKGKAPIAFTALLKKLKLSEDAVKEEAGKLGIEIAEEHFEYIVVKPSKAKKVSESSEKKGKGRPKKMKKVLEIEGDTNDLFASLVAQANGSEVSYESDSDELIIEKVTKPKKSDDEKEAKRKAKEEEKAKKEAEKEAKRLAAEEEKAKKEAEKEAKRLAAEAEKAKKEAEKEAKRLAAEAEKKAKEEEKAKKEAEKKAKEEAKKAAASPAKKEAVAEKKKDSPKKEKQSDEPDVVKRFEFEGKKYLKSKNTGIIYNMEQDVVGKWNEATQKIDFYEDGSDAEEEEEEYEE